MGYLLNANGTATMLRESFQRERLIAIVRNDKLADGQEFRGLSGQLKG
jgi:hypothetical protein